MQYFHHFSNEVLNLFCFSFLNTLSQINAVCVVASETRSSFRISQIFIQIFYFQWSYCSYCLLIYLCSRQYLSMVNLKHLFPSFHTRHILLFRLLHNWYFHVNRHIYILSLRSLHLLLHYKTNRNFIYFHFVD